MEPLSIGLSSSPPFPNHPKIQKPTSKSVFLLTTCVSIPNSSSHSANSNQPLFPLTKKTPTPTPIPPHLNKILCTHSSNLFNNNLSILKTHPSLFQIFLNPQLSFLFMGFSFPLSCYASEATVPSDQVSNKINLEAILVSIDDFFNRNPFFVAGVVFVWLFVIPFTQEYLQKYKLISAINAFKKLREEPNSQLLDIRDKKSLEFMGSPNLKILNKNVVQVEFLEGDEEGFVKKVKGNFKDPANTIVCILDNFDGDSLKVAELLFNNGFKEAYGIRAGVRGKNGWQAIQETLLPPSVHIYPRKKVEESKLLEKNGGINLQSEVNNQSSSLGRSEQTDNGSVKTSIEPSKSTKNTSRPLSPYSMYPDMKPPSSPTPLKPKNDADSFA